MAAPPGLPPPEELKKRAEEILAELEKGPWPSYVKELKKTGYPWLAYGVGLAAGKSPWAPSVVRVSYVMTGVLARVARDWVPGGGEEVHFRVFVPPGKFYPTWYLRKLIDVCRKYSVGLVEAQGQTGAIVIILKGKEVADDMVDALREVGTDVGGSGDAIRALNACVGPALCEFALFDTLGWYAELHKDPRVNDHIVTPTWPYKFKFKISGCPLDCGRSNRADCGLMGVWEGAPEVDQELLRKKIEAGEVNPYELEERCPSGAIRWDPEKRELHIDGERCKKSMECIRRAFPAIKPNKKTAKVAVLLGGNNKGRFGPKLGWFVTFVEPDLNGLKKALDIAFKAIEVWDREALAKDRLGDYIIKVGFSEFLKKIGVEPQPIHAASPTDIHYVVLSKEKRDMLLKFTKELKEKVLK